MQLSYSYIIFFLTVTAAKLNFQVVLLIITNTFLDNCTNNWKNLSISAGCLMYKLSLHFCVDGSAPFFPSQKLPFQLGRDMKLHLWSSHWAFGCYLLHLFLTALWLPLLPFPLIMEWMMHSYSCSIYMKIGHHERQLLKDAYCNLSTYSLEQTRNFQLGEGSLKLSQTPALE